MAKHDTLLMIMGAGLVFLVGFLVLSPLLTGESVRLGPSGLVISRPGSKGERYFNGFLNLILILEIILIGVPLLERTLIGPKSLEEGDTPTY